MNESLCRCAFLGALVVSTAVSAEAFRYQRQWPALQQPWYYVSTRSVAVDGNDQVFVVDSFNHRIHRFSRDGRLTLRFGREGVGLGELMFPIAIAAAPNGHLYVAETDTGDFRRIQIFDPTGQSIGSFGGFGGGPGEFGVGVPEDNGLSPFDLEVDTAGNVWVSGSNRIQQFDAAGNFLRAIPAFGSGGNPFVLLTGIAVNDDNGEIVALDDGSSEVKVFDASGTLLRSFGEPGQGAGQIFVGNDVELDALGRIHVADGGNSKIIRFELNETDFVEFGEPGTEPGQLQFVWRLDFDSEGTLYVVDTGADDFSMHRVQRFDPDGAFLAEWSAAGTLPGRFINPSGIAVDSMNRVYVTDERNHRVQVFSPDGGFLFSFGEFGTSPGQLDTPASIVIGPAPAEAIYVLEFGGGRIQRFDSAGNFDGAGTALNGLAFASDLAIDASGAIYVGDATDMVRKYDADLDLVTQWGGHTECLDSNGAPLPCSDGQFNDPRSVTVDGSGGSDQVVVGDYFNRRLQRFDTDGNFLSSVDIEFFPTAIEAAGNGDIFLLPFSDSRRASGHFFTRIDGSGTPVGFWGEFGTSPGQLNSPLDLALDNSGRMLIADSLNHRITVFADTDPIAAKAVIVAGGGPFPGNTLWPATQLNANFAYRTLIQQGFGRDNIQYLSADTGIDLDGNGLADDVDAPATVSDLQQALTVWAADADEVLVYLVDHGGDETFRMGGDELLAADTLGSALDQLQSAITGRVTLVYDACQSGSFQQVLAGNGDRVVISSAAGDQSAFFVDGGALSFSNHFFTQVFNGASVGEAFETARSITEASFPAQTPLLEADGDGQFNTSADRAAVDDHFIGRATIDPGDRPSIGAVSPAQLLAGGATSAELGATGVSDDDAVARVWAVIRPPGTIQPRDASDPVRELPRLELTPGDAQRSNWSGTYDGFTSAGVYTLTFNAIDSYGNRAVPRVTTVEVAAPLGRKAVIVDAFAGAAKGAIEVSIPAYLALRAQDYADDDIVYLVQDTTAGSDGPPTRAALQSSLAGLGDVTDLTVTLIGDTDETGGLMLADGAMTADELGDLLGPIESGLPGTLTVVVDANGAGGFVGKLPPPSGPGKRLSVASSAPDQPARFLAEGKLSFTQAFWSQVELGASVAGAFDAAVAFLANAPDPQIPQLDDNGNGFANDGLDGRAARRYAIGAGIVVAGDAPLIGSITPPQSLSAGASATIEVNRVTTTGEITSVFALITPPGVFDEAQLAAGKLDYRVLEAIDSDRFRLDYDAFTVNGDYSIAIYAVDSLGKVSQPATTRVTRRAGALGEGFQVSAGISGTWFDPSHDGEGWLIQVLDDDTALIYWFTYAPTGEGDDRQVWIGAQPGRIDGSNIVIENLITTGGPRFGPDFDSADLAVSTWGDVTFHFDDCSSGRMSYAGPDGYGRGRLDLVRLTTISGTDCSDAGRRADKGTGTVDERMSGTWFDPSHNGEGWLLEILPDDQALSVWFTYDQTGRQAWLISLGKIDGNAIDFDLVQRPLGAFFGSTFDPAAVDRTTWGSMRFEFESCNAGSMSYASDDPDFGSGELALTPLARIQGLACND